MGDSSTVSAHPKETHMKERFQKKKKKMMTGCQDKGIKQYQRELYQNEIRGSVLSRRLA